MKIITANWKPCSVCLAHVGLGKNKASKLLAVVSPNVISVEWRKRGINNLPITKASTWRLGPKIGAAGSKKKWYYKDIERTRKMIRDSGRKSYHRRIKTDANFKLKCLMRSITKRVIKCSGKHKDGSTEKYLGCTYAEAKQHIEKQFKRGMTWANHGDSWEIDHIMPLAAFNLTDPNHIKLANHYTNLRPLWKHENRIKSDSIIDHQALLL